MTIIECMRLVDRSLMGQYRQRLLAESADYDLQGAVVRYFHTEQVVHWHGVDRIEHCNLVASCVTSRLG